MEATEQVSQTLTSAQSEAMENILEGLRSPHEYPFLVLSGYAGTGKTFMLKYALTKAVEEGLLDWGSISVCAPTHNAVGQIQEAIGIPAAFYGTLHSYLGLRPEQVKLTGEQEKTLYKLMDDVESGSSADWDVETEQIYRSLKVIHELELEGKQSFVPKGIDKGLLEQTRLILVDEASMVGELLFSQIILLKDNAEAQQDLQVLFIGDPMQLPPVGEKMSRAFSLPSVGELNEIVRYQGAILQYCTTVRETAVDLLDGLHFTWSNDEDLMILPMHQALPALAELFKEGEESVQILSRTNVRVDELNQKIRRLVHSDAEELFYIPGDTLLTREPVMRGASGVYGSCGRDNKGKLLAPTSTRVQIKQLIGGQTWEFQGRKYERLEAVAQLEGGEPIASPLLLLNPNQWDTWQAHLELLSNRAKAASSTSKKKGARGQEGDKAQEAWDYLGIKNWHKNLDGSAISLGEFQQLKKRLWREYYTLSGFADLVSYSYASTVHRAQGRSISTVALDMSSFHKRKYASGEDDLKSALYTAATRAQKQIVFME